LAIFPVDVRRPRQLAALRKTRLGNKLKGAKFDKPTRQTKFDPADQEPTDMDHDVTKESLLAAIAVLEAVLEDRGQLLALEKEDRDRLFRVTGRITHPGREGRRQTARAKRNRQREDIEKRKLRDKERLDATGIRAASNSQIRNSEARIRKGAPPQPLIDVPNFDQALIDDSSSDQANADQPSSNQASADQGQAGIHSASDTQQLEAARNCYVCKQDYRELHAFYDALCPECAEFNWTKREQSADLSGRYTLLTGGRVKIGYHVGLKLLRAGAHLVVTTRFPRDAARRYSEEPDHEQWMDRLTLYGIDLRDSAGVITFTEHLKQTLPQLDFVINNACQTVRRPPQFYAHLVAGERSPTDNLSSAAVKMLSHQDDSPVDSTLSEDSDRLSALSDTIRSAALSQIPLTAEDKTMESQLFPRGIYDWDEQQVDMRKINSWRLRLAEVSPVELVEVHLVNAIAPFILNGQLKSLMTRTASRDKHIVNVSAMEGVFYRAFKRDTHPHTNMAKASLNMMTRTSAADYIKDGIHMNSVDTGWINDEDPLDIAERKKDEFGFHPPLDYEDAAARICDPIFAGLNSNEHVWGVFLKDYKVSNW
jgi:NAD(P)-dependent dehydrogenase (short-subunit alcohol dehydrogenase family)